MIPEFSKETVQEMKDVLEKDGGKEVTWGEAEEATNNLARLAELMFDCWMEDEKRKKKLEENPKGFHMEGRGYSCPICGYSISNEETWYDKWGNKCLVCQKAIDKKVIPGSCVKNRDSWYSKYDLESRFNLNHHDIKKLVKESVLKPRIILGESNRTRAELFLIKDNKDTLPPKKLTESQSVKEEKDGKIWFRVEPWYRFVDPHKHLEDYKIMDYLKVVHKGV